MTFLPADSEDVKYLFVAFFCFFLALDVGICLAFGIGGGIFWHCMLTFFWHLELPMAFFEISVRFFDIFVQQGSLVTTVRTNHRLG